MKKNIKSLVFGTLLLTSLAPQFASADDHDFTLTGDQKDMIYSGGLGGISAAATYASNGFANLGLADVVGGSAFPFAGQILAGGVGLGLAVGTSIAGPGAVKTVIADGIIMTKTPIGLIQATGEGTTVGGKAVLSQGKNGFRLIGNDIAVKETIAALGDVDKFNRAESPLLREAIVAERQKIGRDAEVMSDSAVALRMIDRTASRAE